MEEEGFHHGPWCAGTVYEKFEFFSYGEKDYIVTSRHIAEPKYEPKPMASNRGVIFFGYYYIYRGVRELGTKYGEKEVFKHDGDYYLVKTPHTATANNAPSKREESPSFRKIT